MCEVWKEIEGYGGYFVSNKGHVKNDKGLVTEYKSTNRIQVGVKGKDGWRRYDVGRLVAKAFLPNPYNLNTVIHKDGDYHNNNVDNLEWCSRSACPRIANRRTLTYGEVKEISNSRKRAVFQICESGEILCRYSSIQKASKMTGIAAGGIHKCLNGTMTTSGGYRWAYAD